MQHISSEHKNTLAESGSEIAWDGHQWVWLEVELFFLSFFLGPLLLFDSATKIAIETLEDTRSDVDDKKREQQLHLRVLSFIEATYESLPQAAISTALALGGAEVNPVVLMLSLSCSVAGVLVSLYHFVANYTEMLRLLSPSAHSLKEQALKLGASAAPTDSSIYGALKAALDHKADPRELAPAIKRLLQLRVNQFRTTKPRPTISPVKPQNLHGPERDGRSRKCFGSLFTISCETRTQSQRL